MCKLNKLANNYLPYTAVAVIFIQINKRIARYLSRSCEARVRVFVLGMLICIAHLSVVHYCHDYSSDAHANMSALFLTVCAHGWFYQIDLIIILESESNYPLGGGSGLIGSRY